MRINTPFGKNIVVFDCEIKNTISPETGIGWKDYDKMGISVAVAFHYFTGEFKVFMDDNLSDLVLLLNQADIVSGFNITGFDLNLLAASSTGLSVAPHQIYDIYPESKAAAGLGQFAKGCKLDDHLEGTFGKSFMKTAHGAQAPLMWQERRLGELISYCMDDCKRECELFTHIYAGNAVRTPLHGWRQFNTRERRCDKKPWRWAWIQAWAQCYADI